MKRALVMGLGRFGGGLGVARQLLASGHAVTVTDLAAPESLEPTLAALEPAERAAITWRLGEHVESDFTTSDLVVVNPAVPPTSRFLDVARAAGVALTSEVELYLQAESARGDRAGLVLVTGTQGKSSTANLAANLLTAAGAHVTLAGNIGRSLLAALPREERAPRTVVAELSSYQLEALAGSPHALADVAIVTNLLVDHLARHGTPAAYHRAKLVVLDLVRPGGTALVPASVDLAPLLSEHQKARLDAGDLRLVTFDDGGAPASASLGPPTYGLTPAHFVGPGGPLAARADLCLPGAFQHHNALAALAAARLLLGPDARLDLGGATGLAHRSERLGTFGDFATLVIDNGVSTTPDSTLSALLDAPAPVILVMGGQSKHMPLDGLVAEGAARLARVVTFGAAAEEFARAFVQAGVSVERCAGVEAAVERAFSSAQPGESLLFSPAAASFDAYTNFEARARAFRAALPPRRTPSIPL